MPRTVVGMFDDWASAQRVVEELMNSGFRREDVSIMASREHVPHFQSLEAAGADTGAGAAIGGIGGFIAGIAALAIPGIGPILAAGPLAAGIIGATVGAAGGALVGALSHHGIPEEEADVYSEGVRRGSTLVAVHSDDLNADKAVAIMNREGAVNVEERVSRWRSEGWQGRTPRKLNLDNPGRIEHVASDQVGRSRATEGGAKIFTW